MLCKLKRTLGVLDGLEGVRRDYEAFNTVNDWSGFDRMA